MSLLNELLDINTKKTAVIITGNAQIINSAKYKNIATKFYKDIKEYLESKGYSVTFDPGLEYTRPNKADLWIGHSRGASRLKYAYTGTKTLAFGDENGINHPKDTALKKGNLMNDYHFIFCKEMKEAIDTI